MSSIRSIVDRNDTIVCAGCGGVGKTTASAAIALWGAMQGKKTVVLTIDPAKRLADSLGIEIRGNRPSEVAFERLPEEVRASGGSLSAMMLDQKGAWDALVERHAPSDAVRDQVLRNRFYQQLSQTFAGSQEYMAIEELCALQESGEWDLIVLDTPPSRHALDFLEAPRRMGDFLDRDVIQWFVKPPLTAGFSAFRIVNQTARFVMRRLEDVTGIGILNEIADFFEGMSGIFEGFGERLERVYATLRGEGTAFLLVSGAEVQVLEEARYLEARMKELGIELRAVIFNRMHLPFDRAGDAEAGSALDARLERSGVADDDARSELVRAFDEHERLARGERRRTAAFVEGLRRDLPVARVPDFPADVHDVEGLRRMHRHLFEEDA